jgi:hypothetical protein
MKNLSAIAKAFIGLMVLAGGAGLADGLLHWKAVDWLQFIAILIVASAASRLKVKLPGINGCMSVNLPFFLIAAAQLSLAEALIIGCAASLVQSVWASSGQMKPTQVLFNAATMTNAVAFAAVSFGYLAQHQARLPLAMAASGLAFFLVNTLPVAIILWLAEEQNPLATWVGIARLTFPYYVLSTGVATTVCVAVRHLGWQAPWLLLPLMYFIHRSYQLYFSQTTDNARPLSRTARVER